jgi:C4-dicarboxylate-binding protein DctP
MKATDRSTPILVPIVGILLLAWLVAPAAIAEDDPIVIRFSHVVGENTPKGIGANRFKQLTEERLAGKVRVEVYPSSRRFTDDEALTALLFGDLELAAPSLAKFRRFTKRLQVFDLPFLFDDVEAVHRFQASEPGQALLGTMVDRGIKGLAYWDNGMRVMSANKPLRTPADVEGLTFRIEPSRVMEMQYRALGATTLRLPFKKVFDALDIGLVDGQENAWSNIASQGFHKVQKSFTATSHSFLGYMVVTNAGFWEALPNDIRTTLEEILAEVSVEVNRIAAEQASSGQQAVAAAANVLIPTAEEREAWRRTLQPVWQDFEQQIGKEIIEAALAANDG